MTRLRRPAPDPSGLTGLLVTLAVMAAAFTVFAVAFGGR